MSLGINTPVVHFSFLGGGGGGRGGHLFEARRFLDCEQSVFVRENPTRDKKSRKYANEGKERGENKARHEKNRLRRFLCFTNSRF